MSERHLCGQSDFPNALPSRVAHRCAAPQPSTFSTTHDGGDQYSKE